jgi:hypothetical protein
LRVSISTGTIFRWGGGTAQLKVLWRSDQSFQSFDSYRIVKGFLFLWRVNSDSGYERLEVDV